MKAVVLVGMFPPPVHGMAAVNRYMEQALRDRGRRVEAIDLSPGVLSTRRRTVGRKVRRVVTGAVRFMALAGRNEAGVLYMGLSGAKGQLYELVFILIARLFGVRVFLHHHSFAYVDRRSRLFLLVMAFAGRSATHIVLCERMRSGIENTYGRSVTAFVLSNFAFVPGTGLVSGKARTVCRTIGFLSNISPEKGIMQFLELASRLKSGGSALKVVVAGPFENQQVARSVTERLREIGAMDYRGAVYGQDKQAFFDDIDVLVFPSRYVHEAEPVTVIEALARGIPVITTARGCLPTLVPSGCGCVVPTGADFVSGAIRQLQSWVEQPEEYRRAVRNASEWAANSHEAALDALSQLCAQVSGGCG